MKKIFGINAFNFGSTGRIMLDTLTLAKKKGHEVYAACMNSRRTQEKKQENQIFIGSRAGVGLHVRLGVYTGRMGQFSRFSTYRFLKKLDRLQPDILHLHNLHGWFINYPMLFRWIKKRNIKVIWTLHDCWAFTGHCPYFDMAECSKWKTGCHACSQYREYPQSKIDNSKFMYRQKKKWFTGVRDLTIVAPSAWIGNLVKTSFLKEYPVQVIHNGIDLSIFKPTESDLRQTMGLSGKIVLLGCADAWGKRKGLDVFASLSKRLGSRYAILLVGLEKKDAKDLPPQIQVLGRTDSPEALAKLYTLADVFVNPTREEMFGLVNLEALACGTPVVMFNTGGSPETIDESCGIVVEKEDIDALEQAIRYVGEEAPFSKEACLARAQKFDVKDKYEEYIALYERS